MLSRVSIHCISGQNLSFCDLKGQRRKVNVYVHGTMWKIFTALWKNGQGEVKTICFVYNCIFLAILANCWNHGRRSMSYSSMSYGVHKVAISSLSPLSQLFWTLRWSALHKSIYPLRRGTQINSLNILHQ